MNFPNTWTSKTFKRAAQRHFISCVHFLENLEHTKIEKKTHVIANVYYLSGYVLECILKYYLLEQSHFTGKLNLEDLENLKLKTHNIQDLWTRLEHGFPKKDFKWTTLGKKWDVITRYDCDNIELDELNKHFEQTVKPIYLKIRETY